MTAQPSSRRSKRLVIVVSAVLTLAVIAAAVVAFRGDDDGLGPLRDLSSVSRVGEPSGSLEVRLKPGSTTADVEAVLRAFPENERGSGRRGSVLMGEARLLVEGSADSALRVVEPFVKAAGLASPKQSVTVPSGSSAQSLTAVVEDRAQAFPLALEVIRTFASDGRWPVGFDGFFVNVPGGDREALPVTLGSLAPGKAAVVRALTVAKDSPELKPVVSGGAKRIELRVLAKKIDDAGEVWRSTNAALGGDAADLELYVDVMQQERPLGSTGGGADTDLKRRPVLFGAADDDPAAAVTLLGRLARDGTLPAVATDRSFAQATVDGYDHARGAAALAVDGSVDEFKLTWTAKPNGTDIADLPTVVDDRPEVVRDLLGGIQSASGVFGVSWARPRGTARLSVFLRRDGDETAQQPTSEQERRSLMTRVRGIDWPGSAEVKIPIGPGDCTGSSTSGTAVITSSATGRATKVEVGSACTDRDVLEAVERDWNAAPSRGPGS